jgi:hypothetical protein
MHNQVGKLNTTLIWHANEVTSTTQRRQFAIPNYYIPRAFVSSRLALVVKYYTSESVLVLNPTTTNLELERNQLLNWLEQLYNLEQKPSHWSSFQQHAKPVDVVVTLLFNNHNLSLKVFGWISMLWELLNDHLFSEVYWLQPHSLLLKLH